MKKLIPILIALVMVASLGVASASTNVFRTDTSFSINFDDLNTTEAHAMALKKGDELYLSSILRGGNLSILIRKDGGETLFEGSQEPEAGYTVEIPEDGIYRFTVTGINASGSVMISMKSATTESESPLLFENRQQIYSTHGYTIAYDPDYFVFLSEENADLFYARSERLGNPLDVSMSMQRVEASLDAMAQQLLAMDGVEELSPSIVNFRAARNFGTPAAGAGYDETVTLVTVVECGENEVFVITSTYFTGAEGASERMQNMINSIQFLY